MNLTTRFGSAIVAGFLALAAPAQSLFDRNDERDLIVLTNGKELHGRVLQRHTPDEVLLLQGNRRVRVDKNKITRIETVRDQIRAFFKRREGRDHGAAATHWEMCEWARKRKLPHLARVAAYATLARDPDHDKAHEFLEHRLRGKTWMWKLGSRYMPRDRFEEYTSDIGHGLVIQSENFVIETDAGLMRTCDALYDLERLYVWWLDEHGPALQLEEILEPLPLKVFDHDSNFPALSSQWMGYFVPKPYDDRTYLFYEENQRRPKQMFTMASQHLLYRTLVGDADPGGPQERFCAWIEFGVSQWAESQFHGDPGQAEPGDVRFDRVVATLAASNERYSLKNMLHLQIRDHFYATS
ncbi:MAG: hypothetical protein KDB80_05000, partial [Planctomycetes bacterium]|nr:hypothetical protein [Planctomycetota bacterium]